MYSFLLEEVDQPLDHVAAFLGLYVIECICHFIQGIFVEPFVLFQFALRLINDKTSSLEKVT